MFHTVTLRSKKFENPRENVQSIYVTVAKLPVMGTDEITFP